jgi:outer membrane protein
MKKGMIVWNVALTVVAAVLLYFHFTGSGGRSALTKRAEPVGPFRMAYFEMDSVAANFDLVKELKAEMQKKEEAINADLQKMADNMQRKYEYYQQQANTGLMNEKQSEVAGQEMRTLDDQLKNRKQALDAEYGDFVMRRQNEIKSTIEAFLAEYNKEQQYSYIVSYEQGLFYYKDTAYNITADLIKGLNEKYKQGKNK